MAYICIHIHKIIKNLKYKVIKKYKIEKRNEDFFKAKNQELKTIHKAIKVKMQARCGDTHLDPRKEAEAVGSLEIKVGLVYTGT